MRVPALQNAACSVCVAGHTEQTVLIQTLNPDLLHRADAVPVLLAERLVAVHRISRHQHIRVADTDIGALHPALCRLCTRRFVKNHGMFDPNDSSFDLCRIRRCFGLYSRCCHRFGCRSVSDRKTQ